MGPEEIHSSIVALTPRGHPKFFSFPFLPFLQLDGAYFGTTMAHLLFSTFPELVADVPAKVPFALAKPVASERTTSLGDVSSLSSSTTSSAGGDTSAGPAGPASAPAAVAPALKESRDAAIASALEANRRKRHRRPYKPELAGRRCADTLTHLRNPHPKLGWLPQVYQAPWPGAFKPKYEGEPSTTSSSLSSWEGSSSSSGEELPDAKRPAIAVGHGRGAD